MSSADSSPPQPRPDPLHLLSAEEPGPPSPDAALRGARDEISLLRSQLEITTLALDEARQTAQIANDAKDRFLSSISHELRTPLSAMVLWTSLIEDQKIIDQEQLREALDAIKRSAEEQRLLIEALVDTSRLVSGKLRLDRKEIDIAAVVRQGIDDVREAADEKGITVFESLDPAAGLFHGDGKRLQQVVRHLVQNAVKFTPASGRVTIELQRIDQSVQLRVSDTGIGIAREYLDQIFGRFVQVEHVRVRTEKGLGLGLSVVKQIVEMHGGNVTAQSEGQGRGAAFIVSLTDAAVEVRPVDSPGGEKTHLAGLLADRYVLVIEDAPATRRALTAVLREAGAEVAAVDSAPAAWEVFERRRPDLIVSDLGLPTIDGYTLLRQIRETEHTRHLPRVPAIAVTAFSGDEVCDQALESGFQTCLTKPVEPLHLVSTLASLVESSS